MEFDQKQQKISQKCGGEKYQDSAFTISALFATYPNNTVILLTDLKRCHIYSHSCDKG